MEIELAKLYTNPDSPAAFAGIDRLWEEARKKFPNIKKKEVEKWLEGNRTYTLHRPRRIRFQRSKTIPSGFMTDVQVDLADMQKLTEHNDGMKYILVAIDVLSRRVFALPVKSKSSSDMIHAFDKLFATMPMKPHRLFSDKGKEFEANELKKYFKKNEIEKYKPNSSTVKCSVAERCIRNIKQRLHRYFSEKETLNWVSVLSKIVEGINNSKSRTHNMKPSEIGFENAQEIWERLYGPMEKYIHPGEDFRKPRFKKDDHVRMSKNVGVFHKGYWPSWTDEILEIDKVKHENSGNPTRYRVRDENNEKFEGYFYEPDLARVQKNDETTYRIEKLIRTKTLKDGTKKYLVKFFDDNNNYWIDDSHLAR